MRELDDTEINATAGAINIDTIPWNNPMYFQYLEPEPPACRDLAIHTPLEVACRSGDC